MNFLKKHWQLTLFVIAVLSISGYLFYQSQQSIDLNIRGTKVKTPETPTEKAPVGDTSQGGHWHGDEWHAEPHPEPVQKTSSETPTVDAIAGKINETTSPAPWSPVPWTNPLTPDKIPKHLRMPPEWVNWDYMTLVEEVAPVAYAEMEQHLLTLRDTVIKDYNPKRPIAELWPAFIEAEKLYHANSEHAKKYPVSIVSGFRADWYYQGIWNFPEIHEMIRSEGGLSGQWYNVFRVEMGDLEPDWNLFHLHDGRIFRVRDDKNYQFYNNYNEESRNYASSYSFSYANPQTVETIHVYLDTISDAEFERIQGWNYNFNPYTGKPISR